MLAPLRALSLLALVTLTGASANPRDVATFFLPELLPPLTQPAEHKLVTQQLAALGIDRFVPPTAQETKETNLWSMLTANHEQIGLVWSAGGDVAPPLDALSFPSTFRAKINVVPGSQLRLTDGDAFYQHIRENQHQKEKFNFNFVPNYLVLPRDQAELPKVFAAAVKRVEFEMKREDDAAIYQRFLVRELPKNGYDNALPTASVISSNEELQSKLTGELAGKTVEVTQYVEPYLIDGHKFQVGFYVAITSIDPLRVYYYSHPQIKIAKTVYPSRLNAKSPPSAYNFDEYIAPWDFPDLQKLYYEFPSADRTGTNSWNVVKRYMMMQGLDTTRLQQQIDAAIASSIVSSRGFFQSQISKLKRSTATGGGDDQSELEESFFQLLRFDMEVDDSGKPWLTRIHANPSLAPTQGVIGTDAAIKTSVVRDLLHLVGVPSQSKPSFDAFFKPRSSSKQPSFCAQKCQDNSRTWDATCWSCPGWFTPTVAQRLFGSVSEYARRGGFKLVFPSLDGEYTKFLDNALSQHDQALSRYIKSLSQASAETQPDESVVLNNHVVTCVYREHCSGNGDCVNGKCACDDEYEGATCYIPKDQAREKRMKLAGKEAAATKEGDGGGWNLWNREPASPQAKDRTTAKGVDDGARIPEDAAAADGGAQKLHAQDQGAGGGVSGASVLTSVAFVGIFMYVGYQVYVAYVGSSDAYKKN